MPQREHGARGRRQRGDAADADGPAHAEAAHQQAGDRPADGRAAEEDDRPERHDAAAHRVRRVQLQQGVRRADEQHAGAAHEDEQREPGVVAGDERQRDGDAAEGEGGADEQAARGPPPARHEQGAGERPDAHGRGEDAVGAAAAAEHALGQQRQHHRVVVGQRADDGQHDQRDAQRRRAPRVAKPGADLPGLARDRLAPPQLAGPHDRQGADHGDERHRVHEEAGRHARPRR